MKGIFIAIIVCVIGMLAGCTMSETSDQHAQRLHQQNELQMRMLVEDLDAVLLLDRTSSLSDWTTRIGN